MRDDGCNVVACFVCFDNLTLCSALLMLSSTGTSMMTPNPSLDVACILPAELLRKLVPDISKKL